MSSSRLVLLLALFFPLAAFAQTGSLRGTVYSAASGEPLPGVNVALEGTALGAATDADGTYALAGVPAGRYVLVASSLGFEAERLTVLVHDGETTSADFVLTESALDIGEVVVMARESLTGGPHGVRDLPGSAHYLGPEMLRRHADTDIHRVLAAIPGVNIQEED